MISGGLRKQAARNEARGPRINQTPPRPANVASRWTVRSCILNLAWSSFAPCNFGSPRN